MKSPKTHRVSFHKVLKNGAAYRIRTDDPLITNEMLYQLS